MEFDLSTESGVYGDQSDPSQQYFRVIAENSGFSITFEKAVDSTYDVTVKRPTDLDADQFLENVSEYPDVYPNSEVYVVPEFPIGDQNFEETSMMMYSTRPSEERNDDAIVDVSLEEQMGEEKLRWVNTEKEQGKDHGFGSEIWYINTELRERPLIDHLSQEPLSEKELEEVIGEVEALFEMHDFQNF